MRTTGYWAYSEPVQRNASETISALLGRLPRGQAWVGLDTIEHGIIEVACFQDPSEDAATIDVKFDPTQIQRLAEIGLALELSFGC